MSYRLRRPGLLLVYLLTACAGLASLVFPPVSLQRAFLVDSVVFQQAWAVLALAGGLAGGFGVAKDRWRVERWAAPLAAAGVAGYGLIVWSLLIVETFTRVTQACVILVPVVLFVDRSIHLARKASRIRTISFSTVQISNQLSKREQKDRG